MKGSGVWKERGNLTAELSEALLSSGCHHWTSTQGGPGCTEGHLSVSHRANGQMIRGQGSFGSVHICFTLPWLRPGHHRDGGPGGSSGGPGCTWLPFHSISKWPWIREYRIALLMWVLMPHGHCPGSAPPPATWRPTQWHRQDRAGALTPWHPCGSSSRTKDRPLLTGPEIATPPLPVSFRPTRGTCGFQTCHPLFYLHVSSLRYQQTSSSSRPAKWSPRGDAFPTPSLLDPTALGTHLKNSLAL